MRDGSSQSPAPPKPTLVVGVGAPVGELEAFEPLLRLLPSASGIAFILVHHPAPGRARLPIEALRARTSMPVVQVRDSMALQPNHVYVAQPGAWLAVEAGLLVSRHERPAKSPVDHLFRSLAREFGTLTAGIVMAGAGSDCVPGLQEIRNAAGLTILQSVGAASPSGMSENTVDAGVVDLVLPATEIPAALRRFAQLPELQAVPSAQAVEQGRSPGTPRVLTLDELATIASIVQHRCGFDIDIYKAATVERRVLRRMLLAGLATKSAYLAHLQESAEEPQALLADLRIGVTEFFRDSAAYAALVSAAIEPLINSKPPGSTIRVWVAGCATGEEVYSIAMLLSGAVKEAGKLLTLQIFGTDIDEDALNIARAGSYPESICAQIPPDLLERYFTRVDGANFRIRPEVRDVISFATHDLCKDPPFSRIDLVSCRNVLIYLKPAAQYGALRALHFALEPQGYLWLGTSETTNTQPGLFDELSKKWRLYRKLQLELDPKSWRFASRHSPVTARGQVPIKRQAERTPALSPLDAVRQSVFKAHVPPVVVIGVDGDIVYMHGSLHPYLRLPEGAPRKDLWSLINPALATRVRSAAHKARREDSVVRLRVPLSSADSDHGYVRITLTPVPDAGPGALAVAFEPVEAGPFGIAAVGQPLPQAETIEELEKELHATREDLRGTVEELEAVTEELRNSAEQSTSIQEELQAANEELEATAEELRSLNEELTTVNMQLKDKVEQLELANDDLSNFFSSTRLATLFLDPELKIRRFTPAAGELLALSPTDLNRAVANVARELLQSDLDDDVLSVLRDLAPKQRQLTPSDGRTIIRHVLPYRTADERMTGVVVTFVDITDFKRTESLLRNREAQQAVVSRLGMLALDTNDLQAFLSQAVKEVQRILGTDYACVLQLRPGGKYLLLEAGIGWREGLEGNALVSASVNEEPGYALTSKEPTFVHSLKAEKRFRSSELLTSHQVVSCLSCAIHNERNLYGTIGAYSKARDRFTTDDGHFLQAVAHVVSGAISRCQADLRANVEWSAQQVLADARDVQRAFPRVLESLARVLGAHVAESWALSDSGANLVCQSFICPDRPGQENEYKRLLVTGPTIRGDGVVGLAWEQGRAQWLSSKADSKRGRVFEQLGFTECVAVPIVARTSIIGVLAFCYERFPTWDSQLLTTLEKVGRTLGEFFASQHAAFEQAQLAAIVASSDDAILSKGLDGVIQSWNPGAERVYGYKAHEVVGQHVSMLFPEHLQDEASMILARIARGERVESYETVRVRKDGTFFDVSVTVSPLKTDDGHIVGASAIARDITDRKRAEKRLSDADRQKDQFLAMLGHELRNPLAAIRSATELLKLKHTSDATTLRIIDVLYRQTHHMAHLLDGLLDVSRIIRNKIDLQFQAVNFAKVVREVVEDHAARTRPESVQVQADLGEEPIWLNGDPVRLAQIVDNLVGNAVKFTRPTGSVFLTLEREAAQLVFRVRDTGRGISPELLPHVFDVFRQATQTLDRTVGGLGLGLALVKLLTDLHHGSVEARSDGPDRGAEFIVRLPTIEPPLALQAQSPDRHPERFEILVVEDNQDAATLMCELLQAAGHTTILAHSGEKAWERLEEHAPQIVLCDLGLPGKMTGFDLARRIRSEPRFSAMRVIALSGYGRPEDKEESRRAGFDEHLTKPVDLDALRRVLTPPEIVTTNATTPN